MAYSADKKPGELTALTTLATDDVFVVGDTSDASEVAKGITKANLITDLTTSFATAGHDHTGVYAPALGADDNYVTDAEKAALHTHANLVALGNVSGTNTGDQDLSGYSLTSHNHTGVYQPLATVLTNTTASFTTAQETKLSGIEALADVTDATNVASAGAVMDGDFSTNGLMTRTGAGTYSSTTAPSGAIVGTTDTQTLTNKKLGSLTTNGFVKTSGGDGTLSVDTSTYLASSSNATASDLNTGTDTSKFATADALAGSYAGTKSLSVQVYDGTTDVATGDGKAYITIPESLNGMNLIRAQATVVTAGTTNATTVMVHNKTDAQDMLSGAISIASGGTVGTVGTVNTTYDDVATNDVLRIDVDSVSTTAPKGLMVVLEFRLP